MMYFRGTVGNICLMAEARSVRMTSAFCRMNTNTERGEVITYGTWLQLEAWLPSWNCPHRRWWQTSMADRWWRWRNGWTACSRLPQCPGSGNGIRSARETNKLLNIPNIKDITHLGGHFGTEQIDPHGGENLQEKKQTEMSCSTWVKSVVIGKKNKSQTCVPTCMAKTWRSWGPDGSPFLRQSVEYNSIIRRDSTRNSVWPAFVYRELTNESSQLLMANQSASSNSFSYSNGGLGHIDLGNWTLCLCHLVSRLHKSIFQLCALSKRPYKWPAEELA